MSSSRAPRGPVNAFLREAKQALRAAIKNDQPITLVMGTSSASMSVEMLPPSPLLTYARARPRLHRFIHPFRLPSLGLPARKRVEPNLHPPPTDRQGNPRHKKRVHRGLCTGWNPARRHHHTRGSSQGGHHTVGSYGAADSHVLGQLEYHGGQNGSRLQVESADSPLAVAGS